MRSQNKQHKYIAFISYKREDEKWAKWLQKKLESYRLPTAIRKENPSLPNNIRPIFRDQTELASGKLKEEIEKGLNSSKYLIVICSPHSAKSLWVSKEVQHFIDLGREEYIIPFIIGGTPNAKKSEDECFPLELRKLNNEKELLGINIHEMGRDAAAIKVVARMFDLRFDALWQRYKKEKRKKMICLGLILVFIVLLISSSIKLYYDYKESDFALKKTKSENELIEKINIRESAIQLIREGNSLSAVNLILEKDYTDNESINLFEPMMRELIDSINHSTTTIAKYSKLAEYANQIEIDSIHNQLYCTDGENIRVWDIKSERELINYKKPNDFEDIGFFSISPKYNLIAITEGRGNLCRIFKMGDKMCTKPLYEITGYGIYFTNKSTFWECVNLGMENSKTYLRNIETGDTIKYLNGCISSISDDGDFLVIARPITDYSFSYSLYDRKRDIFKELTLPQTYGGGNMVNNANAIILDFGEYFDAILRNNYASIDKRLLKDAIIYDKGVIINKGNSYDFINDVKNINCYLGINSPIISAKSYKDRYLFIGLKNGEVAIINNPLMQKLRYTFSYIKESLDEVDASYGAKKNKGFSKISSVDNYVVSSNKKIVVASRGNEIEIYNSSNVLVNKTPLNYSIVDLALTPDNKYIGILVNSNKILLYRMADMTLVDTYEDFNEVCLHYINFEKSKDDSYILEVTGSLYEGPDLGNIPYSPDVLSLLEDHSKNVKTRIIIPRQNKLFVKLMQFRSQLFQK